MLRPRWSPIVARDPVALGDFRATLLRGYQILISSVDPERGRRISQAIEEEELSDDSLAILATAGRRIGGCLKLTFGVDLPVEHELGIDLTIVRAEFGAIGEVGRFTIVTEP